MSFWDVNMTLMKGLVVSTELFFLTLLFAIPLGLIICMGSMTRFTPLPVVPLFFACQATELVKCVLGYGMIKRRTWMQSII